MIRPRSRTPVATLSLVAALGLLPAGPYAPAGAAPLTAQQTEEPVPTRLVVRVVAHDAKIIGSGVGGASVTVLDAETGVVLADGVQEGGTGDTGAIMGTRERGTTVYDTPGAASFEATLDLTRPTVVAVEAAGPLDTPHARRTARTTLLMVPGRDLVGEGVVLTLYGFTVKLERPSDDVPVEPGPLVVRADVSMLCGCPIEPGGLWDADRLDVVAQLVREGDVVAEAPLAYAGRPNLFEGSIRAEEPGAYRLRVVAVDEGRANTGMVERPLRVGAR